MSAITIGGIVFAIVFGGALLGTIIRAVVPEHHFSAESKDVISSFPRPRRPSTPVPPRSPS